MVDANLVIGLVVIAVIVVACICASAGTGTEIGQVHAAYARSLSNFPTVSARADGVIE